MFIKYPHIERLGHADVDGIDIGECWVFPKLDGTNASVWIDENGVYKCGSRTRQLAVDKDNAGFFAWFQSEDPKAYALRKYLRSFPTGTRIYGEWLVPHSFRAYRDDAWKRFWIFDVFIPDKGFLPWGDYTNNITQFEGVDVIQPIVKINNPTQENLIALSERNTYLIKDGEGVGEGVVLKHYGYVNRFGRTTWAKFVRNEFKEMNKVAFGVPEKDGTYQPEFDIASHVVTAVLVHKERAKIENAFYSGFSPENCDGAAQQDMPKGKLIPRLLETVYHCVVTEELWSELKRLKDPTLNFKTLRRFVFAETKKYMTDLV